MKPIVVIAAVIFMLGVGVFASSSKKLMKYLMIAMAIPMMKWPSYSLMLFSDEMYRGTSRGMEVSAPYLIGLAICVALSIRHKLGKFIPDAGALLFVLYWLFSMPSFVTCENRLYWWFEIWKMAMLYIVYKAVRGYCLLTDDYDSVMVGFGVVVIANFFEVLKQHFLIGVSQARGLFAHQNSMSMWALLLSAIYFSAYLNGEKTSRWKFYTFCFVGVSASCLRTYSRGSMACMPICFAIVAGLSFLRNFNMRMTRRLMPLFLIGFFGMLLAIPKIVNRFEGASERSGEKRVGLAKSAQNMIKDHPWVGVGLNNWGIKINPPYQYAVHREEFGMRDDFKEGIVETVYLLVWAECGTPCFIILLLFYFWHWVKALQLTSKLRASKEFWLPTGIVGGLTGLYLQSVLEWVLKQSINFCELVIIFAIISALNERMIRKEKQRRLARRQLLAERKAKRAADAAASASPLLPAPAAPAALPAPTAAK